MTERRFNNCFILHVHKELAECVNLEDVAANSGHFPPKKKMARVLFYKHGPFFYRWGSRCMDEYDYLKKKKNPPPPLISTYLIVAFIQGVLWMCKHSVQ